MRVGSPSAWLSCRGAAPRKGAKGRGELTPVLSYPKSLLTIWTTSGLLLHPLMESRERATMKHMGTQPRTAVDGRLAVTHGHRGQSRSPVPKSVSRGPSQSAPVLLGLGLSHRSL